MSSYLEKYNPQTSIFAHFQVDDNLPVEERAFQVWKALLAAKRGHDGLFLVKFCVITYTWLTKLRISFVPPVKESFIDMLRKLGSVLGRVKTQLKKLEQSPGIKNIIQLSAQLAEKISHRITKTLSTALVDVVG